VGVASDRLDVAVGKSAALLACAVAVDSGRGVKEAIAVGGVVGTAVTLGGAGDAETSGTIALATRIGVDTPGVVVPIDVEVAVAWAGVGAETVGMTCPETSRLGRVPTSTAVTIKAGTTKRRATQTIRWLMDAPP
jgi:hypothetical protein